VRNEPHVIAELFNTLRDLNVAVQNINFPYNFKPGVEGSLFLVLNVAGSKANV